MSYVCSICGETHSDLPDIGDDKPYYWHTIPEDERAAKAVWDEDTCVIEDEDYFIRGVIEIPVHDYHRRFGIGVWVSQKKENFETYVRNPDSAEIGPFFGWLSTELKVYPVSTLSLKTMAHFQGDGKRPTIELEPTDHPLAVEQRNGISLARAWEIAHYYLRPTRPEGRM